MNLDRLCQSFVLSLLPLIFLPMRWLAVGVAIGLILGIVAIACRSYQYGLLALLITISYGQVIKVAEKVNSVLATREQAVLYIDKILTKGEYQTAIAKKENGNRIYLNWQAKEPLLLDRYYQVALNIRPISSRLNQGNFNRQRWYFSQGVEQIGTVKHAKLLDQKDSLSFRDKWLERVQQQIKDLPIQGLLLALAFGERAWLSSSDFSLFKQTSTAHLIAISGLHIALAFGFGLYFGKGIQWLCWRFSRLPAVCSSPFFTDFTGFIMAVGYCYLAGFSLPTLRALVAISLILGVKIIRCHYTPWQYWWRTIALLLAFDPMSLLSDSFWLSLLAVASLILWYHYFPLSDFFRNNDKKRQKSTRFLLSLIHLQIGIGLLFLPVQLYFFEGTSSLSFLANLLIVPLYSLVLVPLILFSLLTDNLFSTWQLADWVAQGSLILLIPFSSHWVALNLEQQWHLLSVVIFVIVALWVYKKREKKGIWLMIIPLLFNRLPYLSTWFLPLPTVQWVNFDVGQGLSMALIYSQNGQRKAILYDTGASWKGGSMAELEIIPYLKRQGVELEAVFVSHSDNDHAGGVPSIFREYPNTTLILSQQDSHYAFPFEHCIAGKKWQFGEIMIEAIYPKTLPKLAKNADSCVLVARIGQYHLLFTGDSGATEEREFVQSLGKIQFLQVGHHGSNTSTSRTLLAKIQPDVAMISAGRWNPWKLPTQQIQKRLDQYHILSFNTGKVGMVTVDFYPQRYEINTARSPFSPWFSEYWGEKSPH